MQTAGMQSSRRTVLALLGSGVVGGLAGCTGEAESPQPVTLEVSNTTDEQRELHLAVVSATAETGRSENTLFQRWLTLEPSGSEGNARILVDTFEATKALIRVGNEIGTIGEYTFIPDCPEGARIDEVVRIYLTSLHSVAFDQNKCQ